MTGQSGYCFHAKGHMTLTFDLVTPELIWIIYWSNTTSKAFLKFLGAGDWKLFGHLSFIQVQ